MHLERMKQWVEGLIGLPDNQFNLAGWETPGYDGQRCYCAAAFAATMPEFNKLGLRQDEVARPEFKGSVGVAAVARFFGIRLDEALSIVSPDFYADNEKALRPYGPSNCPMVTKEACIARIENTMLANLEKAREIEKQIAIAVAGL